MFISLPSFVAVLRQPSTRKTLMAEVFAKLLVDCPPLSVFEHDRFLFIFDGLDELGLRDFNLFDDCNLQPCSRCSRGTLTLCEL